MKQTWITVEVKAKRNEAQDIVSLELADPSGKPLPPFSAGSHLDVKVPSGLVRQYSLCNDPAETNRYLIAVLRDPASRGGSVAVHDAINEGDTLTISAPKNHFALAHEARKSLLLAGGIGVTPILCMAERLAMMGANFEMHYAARTLERMAFVDRIRGSRFADRVKFHFDNGAPVQKLDLAAVLGQPDTGTHLYVCGPKGFMDAVIDTAKALGWHADNIHYEYFSTAVQSTVGAAFDVVLASSGKVIRVEDGVTVLDALRRHGVDLPVSCEQGVCGTCVTRVLEGTPDHRDVYFTDEERARNDQFTPCCSRACSTRLLLDL
ncbi:PDR/VanB family oxidoreductase [Azohydromonas lata]|uniref:PDR/VanB family oxidoreductase n=1 Tax=Azohydromonas lata TaxID=45677 RepID=UPI0038993505